jgi:hypothetical protein
MGTTDIMGSESPEMRASQRGALEAECIDLGPSLRLPLNPSSDKLYVHYGCGFDAPESWTNFDASPTLKWERLPILGRCYTKNKTRFPANVRYGDIVKGLPIPDSACVGVYASHVLEHLALDDFHTALDNTHRILEKGGIFRLVVPDLEWAAREYIRRLDTADHEANQFFLQETMLGCKTRSRNLISCVYSWFQTSRHLWMWDIRALNTVLAKHGFGDIRRCEFHDCQDPTFEAVENHDRFRNALAVEAKRRRS